MCQDSARLPKTLRLFDFSSTSESNHTLILPDFHSNFDYNSTAYPTRIFQALPVIRSRSHEDESTEGYDSDFVSSFSGVTTDLTLSFPGGAVASDVRTWHMRHVKSSGVGATVRMLYPRMLAVHLFPDEVGFPDENGRLVMPQAIRCSYARMEPHGAYLVGTLFGFFRNSLLSDR